MDIKPIAMLACIAALAAGTAAAELPNFNYAELAYSDGDVEATDIAGGSMDTSGYQVKGSFAPTEQLVITASWTETQRNASDWADVQVASAAVGWITPVSEDTAFVIKAQYRQDELKAKGLSGTQRYKGPGIIFEVRSNVWKSLELYGSGGFLLSEYEGATSVDLGVVYNISDLLALSASFDYINVDDEDNDYELTQGQLGIRVKF